nr:probable 5-epi-aristolochene synthase 4 [Coffea arabica]
MAKEVLVTHDPSFADRPPRLATTILCYDLQDLAFTPYGDHWRQMRKICLMELLSGKRVRSFSFIRNAEIAKLMESILFSSGKAGYEMYTKEIEVLKVEVMSMLLATGTTMMQKLDFIDKIERLGISYHFEDEIQNQLEQLFNLSTNLGRHLEYDLSTAALQFRLFRWGKELDILSKVPYARDRFVECYFWDVGTIYEPRHSFARMTLAKAIAIAGIIDNTYDAYGTLDELKILTEAVERWDGNGIEQLSDYLKTSYMILLNFNKELEEDLSKKQTSAAFMGMDSATKDVMDWMPTHPKLFVALGKHTRLLNDVGSYKFERETGSGMAIECYMKDYNVFEEEAMKKFEDMAVDAWKDINEQCLRLTTFPRKILKVILNLARLCEVVYKQRGDGFTNQRRIEAHIKAILVDSISL